MLGIAIDAAILMLLLKVVNDDDDVGIGISLVVALVASVGTTLLAAALVVAMGIAGLFVAVAIAAVLLGVAVSWLFDVEIKRAFLIAGLFILCHIGVFLSFQWMMSP